MRLMHWLKKERSGLAFSTLEIAKYEERQGHEVCIKEPSGNVIHGRDFKPDLHLIHSQIDPSVYHDGVPKLLFCHGEPLSSVGNGISMKAILDLAPICDAFICMRKEEMPIWNLIKRTHYIPKGIDLEQFRPLPGITEKLSGEPAVLYAEHWRGQRNPLYLIVAMAQVYKKYPKARLHLYNCTDKKMLQTFDALIKYAKLWPFVRSLKGPEQDVNLLYNRCDLLVGCLHPLFARGVEIFGAGKPYISPGYRHEGWPFPCQLEPQSMANAIISCWENYDKIDYRKWAEDHHDVNKMVEKAIEIYKRYI